MVHVLYTTRGGVRRRSTMVSYEFRKLIVPDLRVTMSLLILLALLGLCTGDMYNVVMPHYLPPVGCSACSDWKDVKKVNWGPSGVPKDVGNSCVMMAAFVNGADKSAEDSFSGPFCYCHGKAGTCRAPLMTPEQINLQMAEPDTVVASFVTYENEVFASCS